MKRKMLVMMICPLVGLAQVGIGTTGVENASAKLEVKSSTQGFLPPRVELVSTSNASSPISSPATGLLVYNTATAGSGATAVTPGFYYYSGSAWVRLIVPTDNAANVSGTVSVANGGTGQTTANAALNALLPDQSGNADKVLVTNGTNTSWNTNVALTSAVTGVRGAGAANIGPNSYTGASITLPPGKWSVTVSMLALTSTAGTYWLRTGFSDSPTSGTLGADAEGAALVSGLSFGQKNSMLNGTIIINNTSGSNKIYYYWTGAWTTYDSGISNAEFINLGRDVYGENTIIAYPMN